MLDVYIFWSLLSWHHAMCLLLGICELCQGPKWRGPLKRHFQQEGCRDWFLSAQCLPGGWESQGEFCVMDLPFIPLGWNSSVMFFFYFYFFAFSFCSFFSMIFSHLCKLNWTEPQHSAETQFNANQCKKREGRGTHYVVERGKAWCSSLDWNSKDQTWSHLGKHFASGPQPMDEDFGSNDHWFWWCV